MSSYDFSGWATKNDLRCSDGRTIRKDAFKECDGTTVPLVWNHQHNDPDNVLGHALLKNRREGVYAYCTLNDTDKGLTAKKIVNHGDVVGLSIYANHLRQNGGDVLHGEIKEVSLVLAGANPGAFIDNVLRHGEESEEEAVIYTGEEIYLQHADEPEEEESGSEETVQDVFNTLTDKQKKVVYALIGAAIEDAKGEKKEVKHADEDEEDSDDSEETIQDVFNTLSEKQKKVVYALIGQALQDKENNSKNNEGGNTTMKHNVFENEDRQSAGVICHADQMEILNLAKNASVGSFQQALQFYADDNDLAHADGDATASGFTTEIIGELFPDYKDLRPGAPELITDDQSWINTVMNKAHKSPMSRVRTRQVDIRNIDALRARGYEKGKKKVQTGNFSLVHRTTDPQTVYVKNALHRDDIVDMTDFDYVQYLYNIDKMMLNEELAIAMFFGDGREDGDADKISPEHIRPIWTDDELYTHHVDLDIAAARAEIQGTNTNANFGDNYIYAEAMINAVLYARENYKGTGTPDFYCTPHLLNVMLLARDLNGRRIYSSKSELATALNVKDIYTVEQMENRTRTTKEGATKKLLALMVNMADYNIGATKGGEVTHFTQFDIDFNQQKSLIETRVSGALTRVASAIAIEEPVTTTGG